MTFLSWVSQNETGEVRIQRSASSSLVRSGNGRFSSSHLFSSAFVIDKGELKNGVPEWFLLTGAGWGHGVGLCQIGAAVMGERGYTYDEILLHYYKGADIRRFY